MLKEERLKSKTLYKIFLLVLKLLPMIAALCYLCNTMFAFIGKDTPVFSVVSGMSVIPWIYIYISSFIFKFCIYHRMFLYYILTVDTLNLWDYYIGIGISDFKLLMVHVVITGIFLFLILYFYVKHHKKLTKENTQ